jgi:uncharacterized lipoprotein NlpE involved in copper resistance
MFKYSVAIIAALAFMGLGCTNISSKTFRPRTVEVGVSGGQTDFSEKGPGSTTVTSSSHGNGHGHNSSSSTRTGRKTTGRYDSWGLGASVGWQIIYKDEEKARERSD